MSTEHIERRGFAAVKRFEAAMTQVAPFLLASFRRQWEEFGAPWETRFGETLDRFVATTDDDLRRAVRGYAQFAIDGMRLQKRFEQTRRYEPKSYQDASKAVYDNQDYMFGLYLPGILLSHYLWPHHYRQLQFFEREFLPRFLSGAPREFCDIGPGTGFYSRQLLTAARDAGGWAFDISRSALEYSRRQVAAFGAADRWHPEIRDVVALPASRTWPFLVCIEVLEHLEDPLSFLRALKRMLAAGGFGLISAAVTAPNEDHIYLYNSFDDVRRQVVEAGFEVVAGREDRAYEPRRDEPVPVNAALIVTTG